MEWAGRGVWKKQPQSASASSSFLLLARTELRGGGGVRPEAGGPRAGGGPSSGPGMAASPPPAEPEPGGSGEGGAGGTDGRPRAGWTPAVGDDVEVAFQTPGYRGAWFAGRVIGEAGSKYRVQCLHLVSKKGGPEMLERGLAALRPPCPATRFNSPDVVSAVSTGELSLHRCVEVKWMGGWWEAGVVHVGGESVWVYFPGEPDCFEIEDISVLRPGLAFDHRTGAWSPNRALRLEIPKSFIESREPKEREVLKKYRPPPRQRPAGRAPPAAKRKRGGAGAGEAAAAPPDEEDLLISLPPEGGWFAGEY